MDTMNDFITTLCEDPDAAFDFIGNRSHEFSRYELADILKECMYTFYQIETGEVEPYNVYQALYDNIAENCR